jgi:hypothetical protein
MAASGETPHNDTSLGLVRDVWGMTAVAILATILRTVAKLRIRQFRLDDVCMIVALVSIPLFLDTSFSEHLLT